MFSHRHWGTLAVHGETHSSWDRFWQMIYPFLQHVTVRHEGFSSGIHQWGGPGHLHHLLIYLHFDIPSLEVTFLLSAEFLL